MSAYNELVEKTLQAYYTVYSTPKEVSFWAKLINFLKG